MCSARVAERGALAAAEIVRLFDAQFGERFRTRLCGGAAEPLYTPAGADTPAIVYFRADYAASALHEVAHWCIAGFARRQVEDYGYWYSADGRDAQAQQEFLRVEARPQALEWIFSQAAGLDFRLSLDNLDAPPSPADVHAFALAVDSAAGGYRERGLPPRARLFFDALAASRGVEVSLASLKFPTDTLL